MEPNFGNRLEMERKRLNRTQVEFGQMGGVSRLSQWKYEHGENFPSVEYLEKLRDSQVDVIYLVTGRRLEPQTMDWEILKDAYLLVQEMLVSKPGKNYTPEKLFDLFKHIYVGMMAEAYETTANPISVDQEVATLKE
jgi:transcriptional regulator with XRE-family HTH domain